ncbi:MAG: EscU/YscU/HrcU family type III secretion system export apparatus switch protein [Candidatus Acidiferrales bacterium]
MPGEDRSERATPRKRQQARERGQVVRSRELPSALTLLAVSLLLRWGQSGWVAIWRDLLRHLLAATAHGDIASLASVINLTAWGAVRWAGPPLAMAWCISAFGLLAQGGFVVSPLALGPNWARLNPVNNISRIFTIAGLTPLLRSLIPLGFMVYLSITIMRREWWQLIHSSHLGLMPALIWHFGVLYEFAWKGGMILLVWSAVDYTLQKWNYERSLRMSRQEVKDEYKNMEGNPMTRGRIRRRQREMRRRKMIRQVARATVVITNPDEFAVALEYIPETMPAPVVLAKGRGLLAQTIKREARWHEVPIVENPPLAQALYRMVEVGGTIPAKLYTAVAEVLAFIYRAQTRMRAEKAASEAKQKGAQAPKV